MKITENDIALAEKIEEKEKDKKFYLGLFGKFRASYDSKSSSKAKDFMEGYKQDKLFLKYGGWRTNLGLGDDGFLEDMGIACVERLEEIPEEWFPILDREAERELLKNHNLETLPREKFTYRSVDDIEEDLKSGEIPSLDEYKGAFELLKDSQYLPPTVVRTFSYTNDPKKICDEYGSED